MIYHAWDASGSQTQIATARLMASCRPLSHSLTCCVNSTCVRLHEDGQSIGSAPWLFRNLQAPSDTGEEMPEIGPNYIAVCAVLLLCLALWRKKISRFFFWVQPTLVFVICVLASKTGVSGLLILSFCLARAHSWSPPPFICWSLGANDACENLERWFQGE